jgi:6-phosphogluconolactonase
MKITNFDDYHTLERQALLLLAEHFHQTDERPHAVMLTGGRTVRGLYEQLRRSPCPVDDGLHLLISDERHVPLDSPESNYGNVRPVVSALGIDDSRVMHVDTELSLQQAAENYNQQLATFLDNRGRITLAILGLGVDGHLASLFETAHLAAGKNRLAIAVPRQPGPDRVSVTRDLLLKVERIVFLVAGAEKAEIVEKILHAPDSVLASVALKGAKSAEIWFSA